MKTVAKETDQDTAMRARLPGLLALNSSRPAAKRCHRALLGGASLETVERLMETGQALEVHSQREFVHRCDPAVSGLEDLIRALERTKEPHVRIHRVDDGGEERY